MYSERFRMPVSFSASSMPFKSVLFLFRACTALRADERDRRLQDLLGGVAHLLNATLQLTLNLVDVLNAKSLLAGSPSPQTPDAALLKRLLELTGGVAVD